jgi:hypothetical protein
VGIEAATSAIWHPGLKACSKLGICLVALPRPINNVDPELEKPEASIPRIERKDASKGVGEALSIFGGKASCPLPGDKATVDMRLKYPGPRLRLPESRNPERDLPPPTLRDGING